MKKIIALLIALILTLSVAAFAEEPTVFKMGIDPEFPPYSYLDDDGNYAGFDVEMAQAVCDLLGWELEIVELDWDSKYIMLNAGDMDCIWSGLTIDFINPDEFSVSVPYQENTQIVLTKADSGIETLADLEGKVIGVQLGTSADILISEGGDCEELGATFSDIVRPSSYPLAKTELDANGVDALIIDLSIASNLIGDNADAYKILDESVYTENYGICFRKADAELCAQVEDAFMALVENGTYLELAQKYEPEGLPLSQLSLIAD